MHFAFLVLLLQVDTTERVDNEDLAILSNNPLPGTGGRGRGVTGCAGTDTGARTLSLASLLASPATLLLLRLPLLHATLLPVQRLRRAVLILSSSSGSGSRRRRRVDPGDPSGQRAAPGGLARKLDVPLDELLLLLPAHVQDQVVHGAAAHEERAQHGGAQARAVPVVVVVGALPEGEAVRQEVVVAVPQRPAQDVGDEREARLALRGVLDGGVDLRLGGRLAVLLLAAGPGLLELLLDLVRVQGARLLAVGLGDVVVRRRARDAQDVVEGGRRVALVRRDLVADAEDLTI